MIGHDDGFTAAMIRVASDVNLPLHEAVHAIIWRTVGEDIVEVRSQDDVHYTKISRPLDERDIIAIMAPEVWMTAYAIACTDRSVSDDQGSVDKILNGRVDAAEFKNRIR